MRLSLILILFIFTYYHAFTQVVINEYSCSNLNTVTDNYGNYEDWVELYNTGASSVDLSGYYMSDKATNPTKWAIPAGVSIPANGYLMVFCTGRDTYAGGYLHPGFKLTQTKPESIVFADPSGTIIEQVLLEPAQANHSRGRTTNGAATWSLFTTPTPNAANANAKQNYATTPVFDQQPGFYPGSINVSITSPDVGVTLYYTTNGSEPTTASTVVSGPVVVNSTTVIRAKAFSSNPAIPASFIETNTYFINVTHTVKVLSICGNQVSNLMGGSYIEPVGSLEYFGENQQFIDEATGYFNKHGNDSWAYNQRGIDFVTKDQMGYNYAIRDKVFRIKNRDEYQRLIIKAAANDNYPFENGGAHIRDAYVHSLSQIGDLKMDERSFEPCVMYVNGQYWGVYDIREKVDDSDFTDYYYNQDENNIDFIKTWGSTWAEYGSMTEWNALYNFIITNDMSIQSNYDYVDSLYNVKSLVDYIVLNSYVVTSDWLNWNTAWWRGKNPNGDKKKWRYTLWDLDATFGHYINYTGIPDQTPNADPCNPESFDSWSDPEGHTQLLNSLMANPEFEQYYICRYADLSNTVFSCPFMLGHLDSLINLIQPEMQQHINKWGGSMAGWQANVQDLRDFIEARCIAIVDGMIDCYDLTGPFQITILVDPPGSGNVEINSLALSSYPWTGTYYGGINTLLYANDAPGWDFDYWELANNTVLPNINDEHVTADFVSDDIIIAHFKTTLSVDIGNDTTICEGDSILLDAGHSGAIFHWQDGSTDSTLWVSQAGTYSVTVTEGFSTGFASITVDVMHGYAGPDHSICYGNSVVLSASGGDFYQWSPPTGLSATNVANPMANPTVTTTYTVTITTAYGCSDIDDVVVSVSPPINLSVIANTYKVCPNEPVVLTPIASDGYGPPYYIFDSAGMVVTPPIYVYPQETTTYEFSVEDVCGSHASASVTIETHPLPVIVISSDTTEGCQPLEVHFQEFGGLDNKSWVWDFGNGDYSMTQNPVYTYNEPGVFDVSITVSNIYNCKASYTEPQMITVHPTPVAKFTADPENVSIIKPQIFFTNMSTGGSIILWSFGDDEESSLISPMHTYPVYPTGTYNVQLVVISDYGCSDTASKEVTVYDEFTFWAPNAFTPDYDGINEQFMIKGNGIDPRNFNMKIYDRWGELIFETDDINEGWDGRVNGIMSTFFPCVYTWLVTYRDLKGVLHEKAGAVTLLK